MSQGIAIDYSQTLHSMMTSLSLSGFALILILFVKYIYSSSLFLLLILLSCSKNTNHLLMFLSPFPNVLFVAPCLHRFLTFFSNTKLRLEKQIPFLTSYFINGKAGNLFMIRTVPRNCTNQFMHAVYFVDWLVSHWGESIFL